MIKPLSPLTRYRLLTKEIPFEANRPRTAQLLTLRTGATLHSTGLHIPADLELDGWAAIGEELAHICNGVQWALGDWWVYGEHKYGERKAKTAAKKLPYEFGTLMNLGWVARKVGSSRRREALSYSHHVEVAKLEPADQTKMLDRAVQSKWSVAALRRAVYEKLQADTDEEYDQHPETQARDWAYYLEVEAERSQRVDRSGGAEIWDRPLLDYLNEATIEKLIENASNVAGAWTKMAKDFKKYLAKRSAAGESFVPRRVEKLSEQRAFLKPFFEEKPTVERTK